MENLKVNETRGILTAHLNSKKTPGYLHRHLVDHCNTNCCFFTLTGCTGRLTETGDCQPQYREDNQAIYFTHE